MGNRPISGCKRVPGQSAQPFCIGMPILIRTVATTVLPGIQGTYRIPGSINVCNPVHLPRDPDAVHLMPALQKLGCNFFHLFYQRFCILQSFPRMVSCYKPRIRPGDRLSDLPCFPITANAAHGCRSNIQTYSIHKKLPFLPVCALYIWVEPRSRRFMISCWISEERSRKFTKVP